MTIGDRLRILRKESGLKVWELAEELSVSPNYISKRELGYYKADIVTGLLYAEYFGVTLDWLVGRVADRDGHKGSSILDVPTADLAAVHNRLTA